MIGKTIRIKGEIVADEDIQLDGQLEGRIQLSKNLTIGGNARVQADVKAAGVLVKGRLTGNIEASGRVDLDGTAHCEGNIKAPRLTIADGAWFQGSIEMAGRSDGSRRG